MPINEALTILKRKPENGQKLFSLIYMTFIGPEKLSIQELTYRLDLSTRQYYRLKREAIPVLSLRLWAASDPIVDLWLDISCAEAHASYSSCPGECWDCDSCGGSVTH